LKKGKKGRNYGNVRGERRTVKLSSTTTRDRTSPHPARAIEGKGKGNLPGRDWRPFHRETDDKLRERGIRIRLYAGERGLSLHT